MSMKGLQGTQSIRLNGVAVLDFNSSIPLDISCGHTGTTYLNRVQLDTGLDDINGSEGSVGDGAANSTGGGSLQVVHEVILGSSRGGGKQNGSNRAHG